MKLVAPWYFSNNRLSFCSFARRISKSKCYPYGDVVAVGALGDLVMLLRLCLLACVAHTRKFACGVMRIEKVKRDARAVGHCWRL